MATVTSVKVRPGDVDAGECNGETQRTFGFGPELWIEIELDKPYMAEIDYEWFSPEVEDFEKLLTSEAFKNHIKAFFEKEAK